LAGDLFRPAGAALLVLERVGDDLALFGPSDVLVFAGVLLRDLAGAALRLAAPALSLPAPAFAAAGFPAAFRVVALAEARFADGCSVRFVVAAFLAGVRWLPVPLLFVALLLVALLFAAAFFLDVVAVPLPWAFVVVAAMVCLWFLTFGRARELLTPGISKGA
jgi:hypothetical protein